MLVAGMVLLGGGVMWLRGRQASEAAKEQLAVEIARLRAAGEPVELADLDPVKQGKCTEAGKRLIGLMERMPEEIGELWDPDTRTIKDEQRLRKLLEENAERLDQIAALVREEAIYLPKDCTNIAQATDLEQMNSVRKGIRGLQAKLYLSIRDRDVVRLEKSILDLICFASVLDHEPMVVDALIAISLRELAVAELSSALADFLLTNLSRSEIDEWLARLSKNIGSRIEFVAKEHIYSHCWTARVRRACRNACETLTTPIPAYGVTGEKCFSWQWILQLKRIN
jgi:hypothetical protein